MVTSVERAFRILQVLAEIDEGLGITDVSRRVNVPKASAYRILQTLQEVGACVRGDDGKFRLGPLLVALGYAARVGSDLSSLLEPVMRGASAEIGEVINLAVRQGNNVLIVASATTRNVLSPSLWPFAELHSSAVGKVWLAFGAEDLVEELCSGKREMAKYTPHTIDTPEALEIELQIVREQGWAGDNEETELGLYCASVPIWHPNGELAAALSASGPKSRLKGDKLAAAVEKLRHGASEATTLLRNYDVAPF